MSIINLKSILGIAILLTICTNVSAQTDDKALIKSYYKAYNEKDYTTLNTLVSDSIVVIEENYTIVNNKKAYIDLVEWGEVFESKNKLKKISVEDGIVVVKESEHSERVKFLYGKRIKAIATFTIHDHKITKIDVKIIDFDTSRMIKSSDQFHSWLVLNGTADPSVIYQINKAAAVAYKAAMNLYQHK